MSVTRLAEIKCFSGSEAVANMFMVLYYQAETGRATPADFREALEAVRQSLRAV